MPQLCQNKLVVNNFWQKKSGNHCLRSCHSNRGIIAKQRAGLQRKFGNQVSKETRVTF